MEAEAHSTIPHQENGQMMNDNTTKIIAAIHIACYSDKLSLFSVNHCRIEISTKKKPIKHILSS